VDLDPSVLELTLPPRWEAVRAVWDASRSILERSGLADHEAYALAMVAQELLENAVKYGAEEDGITLSVRVGPDRVTVEVRSRMGVDGGNLRAFGDAVRRIRDCPDTFGAYVERLQQAVARAPGPSELGLARIAYEGNCALDFRIDGGTLAVLAVYERGGSG